MIGICWITSKAWREGESNFVVCSDLGIGENSDVQPNNLYGNYCIGVESGRIRHQVALYIGCIGFLSFVLLGTFLPFILAPRRRCDSVDGFYPRLRCHHCVSVSE